MAKSTGFKPQATATQSAPAMGGMGLFAPMDPKTVEAAKAAIAVGVTVEKAQGLAISQPVLLLQLSDALKAGLHPSGVDQWLEEKRVEEQLAAGKFGWVTGTIFPRTKVQTGDMGKTIVSKLGAYGGQLTIDMEDELLVGADACAFIKELKEVNPDMDLEFMLEDRVQDELERERENLGGVVQATFALAGPTLLKAVHKQFGMNFQPKELYAGAVYVGQDGDLTTEAPSPDAKPLGAKAFVRKPMYIDPKGQYTPLQVGSQGPNEPVIIGRVSVYGELVKVEAGLLSKTRGTRTSILERFKTAQAITDRAITASRAKRAEERASSDDELEGDDEGVSNLNPETSTTV